MVADICWGVRVEAALSDEAECRSKRLPLSTGLNAPMDHESLAQPGMWIAERSGVVFEI